MLAEGLNGSRGGLKGAGGLAPIGRRILPRPTHHPLSLNPSIQALSQEFSQSHDSQNFDI